MRSTAAGLRAAILFYAIVPGVMGILTFFLLEPDEPVHKQVVEGTGKKAGEFDGVIRALKNKKSGLYHLTSSSLTPYTAVLLISFHFWKKLMLFR